MNPYSTSKEIAVLAGPDLVGALRLAGVREARIMDAGTASASAVSEVLREWIAGEAIGVIILSEDLAALAADTIAPLRKGKRVLPVILELPVAAGAEAEDPAAYYRRLSREFLGMEIVLKDDQQSTAATVDN